MLNSFVGKHPQPSLERIFYIISKFSSFRIEKIQKETTNIKLLFSDGVAGSQI